MQERNYPNNVSFPHHSPEDYTHVPNPVLDSRAWTEELAGMDQQQAADTEHAIKEATKLHSDVHLYRKRGSQFLGIGFEHSSGSSVKIFVYPKI